jgi:alanine-glyoxylate transaminase/serine-glyoxylate transaminase/serine-pyruvate transaminase
VNVATQRVRLMIPGPVDVEEEVLAALALPTGPHYGPDWLKIYGEVVDRLKRLFGTRNDLFLLVGPGTAALDAALGSLMRTGDKVLVAANGFFGERTGWIARGYGLDVRLETAPLDRPVDPEAIRRRLLAERDIQAVAVVHMETSTGVLNPLREIAAVARELDVPIVVDAVSSLGGIPLPVDEWGIDVCITVINKCLACPPGLGPISIGPRAWQQIDRKGERNHGYYLDLHVWKEYAEDWTDWHPYPTTLPTNNIVALLASLRRIEAIGLEAYYQGFVDASQAVRAGLRRLGFELFTDEAYTSPLVTAVRPLPGMDVDDLRHYLLAEWQVMVAGGLEELRGKIFRVGHIGKAASAEYTGQLLKGLEAYLRLKR